MTSFVLKKPDDYSFKKAGISGKKFDLSSLTSKVSICEIQTDTGHETTIIEHECDFIYYILEGKGFFQIDAHNYECKKEDLVFVPAGKKFRYEGKLKMLLISSPSFYPEQEETCKL